MSNKFMFVKGFVERGVKSDERKRNQGSSCASTPSKGTIINCKLPAPSF